VPDVVPRRDDRPAHPRAAPTPTRSPPGCAGAPPDRTATLMLSTFCGSTASSCTTGRRTSAVRPSSVSIWTGRLAWCCRPSTVMGTALRAATVQRGLPGVLAKRRDAPYRAGPATAWVRCRQRAPRSGTLTGRGVCRKATGRAGSGHAGTTRQCATAQGAARSEGALMTGLVTWRADDGRGIEGTRLLMSGRGLRALGRMVRAGDGTADPAFTASYRLDAGDSGRVRRIAGDERDGRAGRHLTLNRTDGRLLAHRHRVGHRPFGLQGGRGRRPRVLPDAQHPSRSAGSACTATTATR
jgi:hypothetical protein